MGVDIAVTSEDVTGNEDRRWLGTRLGTDQCRSVTLDVSSFIAAHVSAKGAIPSGCVLAKITASGLYGPYDDTAVDGRAVAAGLLFNTTRVGPHIVGASIDLTTAADVAVPLFWGPGIVKQSFMPAFAGTVLGEIDAAARADLPMIRWEA